MPELAPGLGLIAVVLFFTLQTENFWSPQTMTAISTVASTIGIVAIGVTMLMICGEFDLSVGQNFAFTPIIWAILFVTNDMNEWLALAIALGFAISVGLVNGYVTTRFGIPSFITTLGMFFVLQGLNNLLISGHQLIMFDPSRGDDAARRADRHHALLHAARLDVPHRHRYSGSC